MAKMNEYPSVDDQQEFTAAEKEAFLGSAMCISTGSKTQNGAKITANIPLTDIIPDVPTKLSDLTDDITMDTYNSTSEAPISGKGVAAALGNFGGFQVVSLTSGANPVPDVASPSNKLIYLTKETSAKKDPYTEWIYTGNPTSALDVSKWEVIGETTVDLSDYYTKGQTDTAISNALDSIAPEQNSVLYGGGSGGVNKPMDVRYDNTLTKVSGANGYELKVAVPVPSPGTNVHRGEVLTVNNSDEAVWAAPASGLPDPTGVTNGYVLTVNNGAASWAAPGGGGGGIIKYEVEYTTYPGDSYAFKGTAPTYSELLATCKSNNLVVVDLSWIGETANNHYARFYFTSYSNQYEGPDFGICFTSWYNWTEDIFCLRMYQGENDSILIYRYDQGA